MAAFAVLFGTRHIDATEHQEGLIVAIAAESLVKLAAFLTVGFFVVFSMFGGIGGLLERAAARTPRSSACSRTASTAASGSRSRSSASCASCCCRASSTSRWSRTIPRSEIRRASWLFPLYLVLINLFVVPIAVAGLLILPQGPSTPTCSCWRCRCRRAPRPSRCWRSSAGCRRRPPW